MAGPLRFRRSNETWNEDRVHDRLLAPLEDSFGARLEDPWFHVSFDRRNRSGPATAFLRRHGVYRLRSPLARRPPAVT